MSHDTKYGKYSPKDCKSTAVKIDTHDIPSGYVSEEEYAKMKVSKQGKHKGSYMYAKRGK